MISLHSHTDYDTGSSMVLPQSQTISTNFGHWSVCVGIIDDKGLFL